ncbi:hypothetical protein NEOKW01_0429 [Nematocida sp. AWRm80]|nr:hypothetical protein NEOKW01_0429 [Nematocida sp. AWRm80]
MLSMNSTSTYTTTPYNTIMDIDRLISVRSIYAAVIFVFIAVFICLFRTVRTYVNRNKTIPNYTFQFLLRLFLLVNCIIQGILYCIRGYLSSQSYNTVSVDVISYIFSILTVTINSICFMCHFGIVYLFWIMTSGDFACLIDLLMTTCVLLLIITTFFGSILIGSLPLDGAVLFCFCSLVVSPMFISVSSDQLLVIKKQLRNNTLFDMDAIFSCRMLDCIDYWVTFIVYSFIGIFFSLMFIKANISYTTIAIVSYYAILVFLLVFGVISIINHIFWPFAVNYSLEDIIGSNLESFYLTPINTSNINHNTSNLHNINHNTNSNIVISNLPSYSRYPDSPPSYDEVIDQE